MRITKISKYQASIKAANFSKVRIPAILDKDLVYFVGILRDGVLTERKDKGEYVVEIYQKNTEWLEKTIKPLVKKLFGIDVKISYQNKNRGRIGRIRIYSKIIYLFLKEVFEHPDTNKQKSCWKTPSIILKADLDVQKAYVQGFFDAEGYINKSNSKIILAQAWNKEGDSPLDDIKKILEKLNIKCSIITKIDKRPNRKPLQILGIYNKEGVLKFIKEIGSRHPAKLEKFIKL